MLLLANDATLIVQHNPQPHDTFRAGFLMAARSISYELDRLRTDSTALIHRGWLDLQEVDNHAKSLAGKLTQVTDVWSPWCSLAFGVRRTMRSKMSTFSTHSTCSRPCGCRAPFSRPAASHVARKPLHCYAQQTQTPRQASDHAEQRDDLGRRQAILATAAAMLLPTLPLSASAKIEEAPKGMH